MNINNTIIEFYTYRRAFVNSSISFELNKYQKETIKNYINSNGYKFDNHITWKNDSGVCFTYSDNNLYIGNSITIKNW